MGTLCKYHNDLNLADRSITEATDSLRTAMPDEMVALVLLQNTRRLLKDLTELVQWEIVQEQIIDLWCDFEGFVHSELTNELDLDRDAENYNKRHA